MMKNVKYLLVLFIFRCLVLVLLNVLVFFKIFIIVNCFFIIVNCWYQCNKHLVRKSKTNGSSFTPCEGRDSKLRFAVIVSFSIRCSAEQARCLIKV